MASNTYTTVREQLYCIIILTMYMNRFKFYHISLNSINIIFLNFLLSNLSTGCHPVTYGCFIKPDKVEFTKNMMQLSYMSYKVGF